MDLTKLPIKTTQRSATINPMDIFKSLTLRGTVQNVWGPQAEGLAAWHEKYRGERDVVIRMNTGGGKTLVGLLIAQSLVNETKGKVLYICPTNQLVEQVATKASECSIQVAQYRASQWIARSVYDASVGPCITNYAALFNGKSIFRKHDVRAVVFDDAHVAGNFVRSQFTLRIGTDHPAFKDIANLFRPYFARNSRVQEFEDALSGNWLALLFVPTFEVHDKSDQLRQILLPHAATGELTFPWEYLKDKLGRCAILISGSGIEITPPVVPVHNLPSFHDSVRRVYLTATMPSQVEFIRTFGMAKAVRIVPGGKSGEAQRQFLFLNGSTDEDRKTQALALVDKLKACIIAPSEAAASEWCPPAKQFDKSAGHAQIASFSHSTGTEKLVLAARYDGIDLPGDACRVLILAGLPYGTSLIDRFTDETLRIERLRSAHVATRVTQAIGRIFRSNTDHGAVLVTSVELERWLSDPQNQRYMPELLQRQIQLGLELRRMVDERHATFEELLDAVLKGRADWDRLYSEKVEAFATQDKKSEEDWFVELATREREAFEKLWDGNHTSAATLYASIADEAAVHDKRLGAWYRHWQGLAEKLGKKNDAAAYAYVRAANIRVELGRPLIKAGQIIPDEALKPGPQALRIEKLLAKKAAVIKRLKEVKATLQYGPNTNAFEQALCDMGKLLGLESSRPEKESGTGPDVLWRSPEDKAGAAFEAKTNKKPTSQYQKKEDIAQFHDHVQWLEKTYPGYAFYKAIVGRKLRVSADANPPSDLRVIVLEQFEGLADRFGKLLEFIESMENPGDTAICIERGLRLFGLTWPNCVESLESSLAVDLKHSEADGSDL
jgi:hypothetical protein